MLKFVRQYQGERVEAKRTSYEVPCGTETRFLRSFAKRTVSLGTCPVLEVVVAISGEQYVAQAATNM